MEETNRLKIKIGPHEFESEGPSNIVQEQFRVFKEMVASIPFHPEPYPQISSEKSEKRAIIPSLPEHTEDVESSIHKIMQFDDDERVISLTVRPKSVEDAVLLILLGQKAMLSHDSVTGGAIMEGITATGGLSISRVDRLLEKIQRDGDVIVIGERRSKRYRLTNAGVNRAREIASGLIFLVP
jgi:hypothetical protein